MNKAEIVSAMAEISGMTKKDSEIALNAFIATATKALVAGEKVQLVGFGSFENIPRKARKGRNPQTQEELIIEANNTAKFKPGKMLKASLNK